MKNYTVLHRRLLDLDNELCGLCRLLAELENTADRVWLSKTCVCKRYTWRGVPGKRLDVLIQDDFGDLGEDAVIELVMKTSKYNGVERPRLVIRRHCDGMRDPDSGQLCYDRLPAKVVWDGKAKVTIKIVVNEDILSSLTVNRLRWECSPEGLDRIVGWHLTRWYTHLLPEIRAYDVAMELEPGINWGAVTLAELNRQVSRFLYRISRNLGWRKLTIRERKRLGLEDTRQWWRESELAERVYRQDGVGEETANAAKGRPNKKVW